MRIPVLSCFFPARYFSEKLPSCPLCGSPAPRWRLSRFTGVGSVRRYSAKCGNCKGLFSFQSSDVTGSEGLNLTLFLLFGKFIGKTPGEPYLLVENVGSTNRIGCVRLTEFRLSELKSMLEGKAE